MTPRSVMDGAEWKRAVELARSMSNKANWMWSPASIDVVARALLHAAAEMERLTQQCAAYDIAAACDSPDCPMNQPDGPHDY